MKPTRILKRTTAQASLAWGRSAVLLLILGYFAPAAMADYGSLNGRSMVVDGQGITATSRVTEVVRFDISETNTDDMQTPIFDDDGGLEIRRVQISFSDLRGSINSLNIGNKVAFVSLYRISQDIDNPLFDFDEDFKIEQNILLARKRVAGPLLSLEVPCEELAERITSITQPCVVDIPSAELCERTICKDPDTGACIARGGDGFVQNQKAIFMVSVETDAAIVNNGQFSVIVTIDSNAIAHQNGSGNPYKKRVFSSRILTVVDSAGDLMPFPDTILGVGDDRFFPYEPHNYTDLFSQHPDALNILEDMEVPQVLPSESSRTAVLGIELAGVHSHLKYVVLNFTSTRDGRNNDRDYWADDPAGIPGVYDPYLPMSIDWCASPAIFRFMRVRHPVIRPQFSEWMTMGMA
ncbi:MAG: hypothetical protein IPI28_14120 [Candidatus Omnitrophica bacterium]|nr:hypothetical protein [Candidatus Omnitrophota bacterium]